MVYVLDFEETRTEKNREVHQGLVAVTWREQIGATIILPKRSHNTQADTGSSYWPLSFLFCLM